MKGTSSATSHKTAPAARREIDYSLIIAPAALVICVIFFTIMNPRFISLDNLMNILRQGGPLFIVSFGLVGVILIGSIDISSDGLLSLAGVSAVMLANIVQDGGGWLSVLLGTGIGLVFKKLGSGSVGFLPTLAIFSAVILILMVVLTTKTKYGRSLYAMGSNERVAGLCGLPTRKYKLIAFTVAGACTGLAGVLMSARLGAGTHSQGQGMSLDAIAAVVMGGTSLSGGKGSVTRTITGVFVILMLNNGLNLMGVSPHVQILVKGIVVILAVAASSDWKSKDIVK